MIHRMRTAAIGSAGLEAGTNQTCPKARHRVPSTIYKASTPPLTSFLTTPIIGSWCTHYSVVLPMGPDNHGYPSCPPCVSTTGLLLTVMMSEAWVPSTLILVSHVSFFISFLPLTHCGGH